MKKTNKFLALVLVLMLALSVALVGCSKEDATDSTTPGTSTTASAGTGEQTSTSTPEAEVDPLPYAEQTLLRMATGYNSAKTGLTFDAETAGEGLTLLDGKTYHTGDLKPTWVAIQDALKVKFDASFYKGMSAANNWDEYKEKLDQVDILSVTATKANEAGAAGQLVDIAQYLDKMPNFKAYLDANPIVRLSITGADENGNLGAIYFSPYFDGSDDIERMPLMRVDWVKALLNGEGQFAAEASYNTKPAVYQPYMPTSGTVEVDVVDSVSNGNPATKKLTKDYSKYGNIIEKMNAAGTMTGVEAVNMLREYIDKTYDGYYGNNRADLFIGQNAAWDADELVALLRCVVANPQTLAPHTLDEKTGKYAVVGLFSREDANNQRTVDTFRFAATLFGVRGLESRQDFLYIGTDRMLHDARNSADTYAALERMNAMMQEGLISADYYNTAADTAISENYIKQSTGFMSYDYNQTQTIWSSDAIQYRAVLVPVAKWYDGTNMSGTTDNGVYMRFTESWRSVKTDAWAISKAGIGNDTNKLNAALKLIDYAYSAQGQITMSYGPDAFISVKDASVAVKTKEDVAKKYNTFKFNGEDWPEVSDATYADLQAKTDGNYTNYARYYLGSTLSFLKSQAFEVQCTSGFGQEGAQMLSYAIAAGIIKHPLLSVNTANMWYTSVPTTLPMTASDNENTASYDSTLGTQFSSAKKKTNVMCYIIKGGYAAVGINEVTDAASMIAQANAWGVQPVLDVKNATPTGPWTKLLAYYMSQNA